MSVKFDVINDILTKCKAWRKTHTVPDTVKRISSFGKYFLDIDSIHIPSSVEIIDDFAFALCTSLKEIKIPEGTTTIDYQAFEGCISLENIYIPQSVTEINYRLFRYKYSKNLCVHTPAGSQAESTIQQNYPDLTIINDYPEKG